MVDFGLARRSRIALPEVDICAGALPGKIAFCYPLRVRYSVVKSCCSDIFAG